MESKEIEKGINNQGCEMEIIVRKSVMNCDILFTKCGTIVRHKRYEHFKSGSIRNPNHPSVHGVGFEGQGEYSFKTRPKIKSKWRGVLERCYCPKFQEKHPTYVNCTVDIKWHNFQVFANWYEENCKNEGFELDKDILFKGNKHYSPETCCFVPHVINSQLIKADRIRGKYPVGVNKEYKKFRVNCCINKIQTDLGLYNTSKEGFYIYKVAKESEIKRISNIWWHELDEKTYQALYNYKVEITD